jgi:hypothetical protein
MCMEEYTDRTPNQPAAVNPAIASPVHSGLHLRGVTNPERSPNHNTPTQARSDA